MDIGSKRPLLIGGLGLSASLWLLDIVSHGDGSLLLGAISIGAGLWWFRQQTQQPTLPITPQQVTVGRDAIDQALAEVDKLLELLVAEGGEAEPYRAQGTQLLDSLDRQALTIAITGNKSTGKSTLLSQLQTTQNSSLTFTDAVDDVLGADLNLLMIAGDMTASELNQLETLVSEGHQVLVVLNKQDQYTPMDKAVVLDRIRTRVAERKAEVVAIAAKPNPIKVRRHTESGEITESFEQPVADVAALTQHLDACAAEPAPLVLATTLRQAKALQQKITQQLNQYRRAKAMPVIEQMQWIAAGTAFANPLATLDLLAAVAINGQLVLDLGAIYGQKFSLDQAQAAAGTIAELTVKLGLVELATQALGTVLKTHVTTYVAGGAIQGISAAYLTRLAGLTLIDYFEEQSLLDPADLNVAGLGHRLKNLFQQARQGLALQEFVTQAIPHLPVPTKPSVA